MNAVKATFGAILLCTFSWVANAATWEYYGHTESKGKPLAAFFDRDGVERVGDSRIRVWTQFVSQKALDELSKKHENDERVLNAIARRIAKQPPPDFFELPSVKKVYDTNTGPKGNPKLFAAIVEVESAEYAVNNAVLNKEAKILYEMDCNKKRSGPLSIILYSNGNVKETKDLDSATLHPIAPESAGEWLLMLACKRP
jgi:hypothetical protein